MRVAADRNVTRSDRSEHSSSNATASATADATAADFGR